MNVTQLYDNIVPVEKPVKRNGIPSITAIVYLKVPEDEVSRDRYNNVYDEKTVEYSFTYTEPVEAIEGYTNGVTDVLLSYVSIRTIKNYFELLTKSQ